MPERADLQQAIRAQLAALQPAEVRLEDDSALHAGHAGAAGGGAHFRLRVVSARFAGLGRIERHRLVYSCLATLLRRDIHALSMVLLTPDEACTAGAE